MRKGRAVLYHIALLQSMVIEVFFKKVFIYIQSRNDVNYLKIVCKTIIYLLYIRLLTKN